MTDHKDNLSAYAYHLQDIGGHHLHTTHGGGQGAHNGGDHIQRTHTEQQLLQEVGREGQRETG